MTPVSKVDTILGYRSFGTVKTWCVSPPYDLSRFLTHHTRWMQVPVDAANVLPNLGKWFPVPHPPKASTLSPGLSLTLPVPTARLLRCVAPLSALRSLLKHCRLPAAHAALSAVTGSSTTWLGNDDSDHPCSASVILQRRLGLLWCVCVCSEGVLTHCAARPLATIRVKTPPKSNHPSIAQTPKISSVTQRLASART